MWLLTTMWSVRIWGECKESLLNSSKRQTLEPIIAFNGPYEGTIMRRSSSWSFEKDVGKQHGAGARLGWLAWSRHWSIELTNRRVHECLEARERMPTWAFADPHHVAYCLHDMMVEAHLREVNSIIKGRPHTLTLLFTILMPLSTCRNFKNEYLILFLILVIYS